MKTGTMHFGSFVHAAVPSIIREGMQLYVPACSGFGRRSRAVAYLIVDESEKEITCSKCMKVLVKKLAGKNH